MLLQEFINITTGRIFFRCKKRFAGKAIPGGVIMPEPKRGPDKFGIEHEIKADSNHKPLSAKELKEKARHFQDKSD